MRNCLVDQCLWSIHFVDGDCHYIGFGARFLASFYRSRTHHVGGGGESRERSSFNPKRKTFIKAAQTLGYGKTRIIWHHILPLLIPPLIVISAANFASAILIESGLSFLGIGAQPPVPSWGDGKRSLQVFAIGKTFNLITRTGHHEFGFGIYDIGEQS